MILTRLKQRLRFTPEAARLFAALVTGLCCAGIAGLVRTETRFVTLLYVIDQRLPVFLWITAAVTLLLTAVDLLTPYRRILPAALLAAATQFSVLLVAENPGNVFFNAGLALVLLLAAGWAVRQRKPLQRAFWADRRLALAAAVLLFLLFSGIVGCFSVVRHMAYGASNFDFGIFAQMFDNMKQTGLPVTTVERNAELTHFAVHFSPALYLLLPGYLLFPCPAYLLAAQAAAVGSGVFAVYAIAKRLGFTPLESVMLQTLYVALPSLCGGAMYDFHENCLLAPLVLWMLYFILRDMPVGYFGFALLVLAVKEDAAIYVMAAALFLLLYRKRYLFGGLLLVVAVAYFIFAVSMVAWCGGAVMVSRLNNYYLPGDDGFLTVMRTCLLNMGYLFREVFAEKKADFLLWVFLPFYFMPFAGRRHTVLTLLIPLLVINLMPDYVYQYDISFQYTFGSIVMVLLAAMLVLREASRLRRHTVLLAGSLCALVLTVSLNMPLMRTYWRVYQANADRYAATTACLQRLPPDAQITATTYLIAHLDRWDTVYMLWEADQPQTEYALVDTRGDQAVFREYIGDAYELVDAGGYCEVYRKK